MDHEIANIYTRPLRLPYRSPLKTASNYFAEATGLLVRIETSEGEAGYGYADLFPRTGETIATAQSVISEVLAPGLEGRHPGEIQLLTEWMNHKIAGNTRAKAAIEMALNDLRGKIVGLPVYELLGGKVRSQVTVMKMVSLADPDSMAREAAAFVQGGIKALKLKIGTVWKDDVERVRRVREAVGPQVFLKVDANQFYGVQEALRVARHVEPYGLETFEQPVAAQDWEGMAFLTQNSPVPIEADQSVKSITDALRVIRMGAAAIINTSPQKVGGILPAKRIADLCQDAGIPCIVSNVGGSALNDAAALQLIASSLSTDLPCEVAEFERVQGDPACGLEIQDGTITVPGGPGLGMTVRMEG